MLLFIPFIVLYSNALAQNLVPNSGFDVVNPSCPNTLGDLDTNALPWRSYGGYSPDMFHGCGFQMPSNVFGYQAPHSGQGYAGLYHFNEWGTWAEKITAPISAMQVGAYYEVSMSVSTANFSHYYSNGLAIHFRKDGSGTAPGPGTMPKVDFRSYGMIFDTANWVRLTDTLYADTAYDRIYIGNFFDTANMQYQVTNFTQNCGCGYSYVDSIVVKLISGIGIAYTDTMLCSPDTIHVPYTVFGSLNVNNVFTLQLSDASGSFANPLNIGLKTGATSGTIAGAIPSWLTPGNGYRIRLISSSPADTSFDNGKDISLGFIAPVKPLAANNSPVCSNDTIMLSASTTTSGVSYRWTGPDTFSSVMQHPVILNPQAKHQGDYIVTARLFGCVAKDTTTVTVVAGPIPANVQAAYNTPVCADDTLKLSGNASGSSLSYSWVGPASFISSQQNPVLPATGASNGGIYWLTVNQGLCSVTDSVHVTIKPRPAGFTAASNSPVCAGNALNLLAGSSSSGVTYSWTGPIGFSSALASPTLAGATAGNSGMYYVTATLNGCPLYDTLAIAIKPLPDKPVASGSTSVCAGDTIFLSATSTTSGVVYNWAGPASYSSWLQQPAIANTTTAMSGDYIVTTILNGCMQSDTIGIAVKPNPSVVGVSTNSPVCTGDTLHITAGLSSAGVIYSWAGPNGFSAGSRDTFVASSTVGATGWYIATLDLSGCLFEDSLYAVVNIRPAAPSSSYSAPVCVGDKLQLYAGNVAGATYNWAGPGNFSTNTQNPVRNNIGFADTGVYNLSATVNGCTSPQSSVHVSANPVPFVSVLTVPGDTICSGAQATFTGLPNNHGGTPSYTWYVNGAAAGSGASYTTTVLANSDVVYCEITEYTKCNTPYTDKSEDVTMTVLPLLAPSVTIMANPNRPLQENEYVVFTSAVSNGGAFPQYQWKRNGKDISGAKGTSWSANTLIDNDSISLEVTSSYRCPQPLTASSNGIRVTVLSTVGGAVEYGKPALFPNPNDGSFTITGSSATIAPVHVEVLNAVGQVIYADSFLPVANGFTRQIATGSISEGIYILKILVNGRSSILRFAVTR